MGKSKNNPTDRAEPAAGDPREQKRSSRRNFLKATGALLVTAGVGSSCRPETPPAGTAEPITAPQPPVPATTRFPNRVVGQYQAVPDTPDEPPTLGILYFFSLHEARTVEALTARIFPGSPEDPGAREAGVVNYIDFLLSHEHGFAQAVYRSPPFAEPYQGAGPPEGTGDGSGYQVIWVHTDELPRYGYQSSLTPREIYRRGLEAVDRYANERFGANLVELTEEQQDAVLEAMAGGQVTPQGGQLGQGGGQSAVQQDEGTTGQGGNQAAPQGGQGGGEETGYYPPSLEDFFQVLRNHTIEGLFADPLYGGNRDLVGWRFLGYPGAQRAYTPREMATEGTDKLPQSIADLPHFHAGRRANEHVLLPVSGTDQRDAQGR